MIKVDDVKRNYIICEIGKSGNRDTSLLQESFADSCGEYGHKTWTLPYCGKYCN